MARMILNHYEFLREFSIETEDCQHRAGFIRGAFGRLDVAAGGETAAAKNQFDGRALRVERAKEINATGKTFAAAKAFLATLDEGGGAKVSFAFNGEQKTK